MEKNRSRSAVPTLLITFFLWGSVYVGAKLLSGKLPPPMITAFRCLFASPLLLVMARKDLKTRIEKEDRRHLFTVAFIGYFLTPNLVQLGIALTGASMTSLINAMTPVSVSFLAAFMLKEKLTPLRGLCILLAVAGAAVITGSAGSRTELLGVLAAIVSILTQGLTTVTVRKLTAKYPAILVTCLGTCLSLPFHLVTGVWAGVTGSVTFDASVFAILLYLAWAGTGIAQYTWSLSLSRMEAGSCSLFYPLQSVFSCILGHFLLREDLPAAFFAGLILVVLDILLNWYDTARKTRYNKPVDL